MAKEELYWKTAKKMTMMVIRASSFLFRLRNGSHSLLRSTACSWLSGHRKTCQEQLLIVESPGDTDDGLRQWLNQCVGDDHPYQRHRRHADPQPGV
jgi:hypothetical protein